MSNDLTVINQEISELKQMLMQQKTNRLNDSLFSKELAPHYMQLASQLSKSMMVPKAYQGKPQDLFVAMAMGYQIGLSVEQSIQAIAVINGKPCLWGDDMLALCMAHPEFTDLIEEPTFKGETITGYSCTVKRRGMADSTSLFTLDMAKKAGLLSKPGPWTQYPERMLQLRARAFALRNRFPDALKGIKSREEVEDYIDIEYKTVEPSAGSRTETLKRDYLNKIGRSNEIIEQTDDIQNTEPAEKNPEPESMGNSGSQETSLYSEIKRLFDEKGFNEERKAKALAYYESDTIENLPADLAEHLIAQLIKL